MPTPSTPSRMNMTEADSEEECDPDDRPQGRSDQHLDSIDIELAEEEQQTSLYSATPIDAPLTLAPYSEWASRPVPDPHSASLSELIDVLIEIVAAEGPVVSRRAYSLYNKAAGYSRLGRQIVHVMNRAIYRAVKLGRLVQQDEQARGGQMNQVVRVTGSHAVNGAA